MEESIVGTWRFRWILESWQFTGIVNGVPILINGMIADLRSATVVARPVPSTKGLECIYSVLCLCVLEVWVDAEAVGVLRPVAPLLDASGVIHDSSGCSLPRNAEKISEVISFGGRACIHERPCGSGKRVQNILKKTLSSERYNARV
jgi:hypothetical protein